MVAERVDLFLISEHGVHILALVIFFKINIAALSIRPNKKKTCFRVTGPHLNLLVKPRIF